MTQIGKRKFTGVIRTPGSSMRVSVEARNESAATEALQARYGTENIVEVWSAQAIGRPEGMSQAEADVRKKVLLGLPAAWFAVIKWVLRGSSRN